MTQTIVFIFLLDHLPGNDLNKTLETVHVPQTSPPPPPDVKCNIKITDPLLQVISRELDLLMVPEWLLDENSTEKFHVDSDASFATRFVDIMKRNELTNSSAEITYNRTGSHDGLSVFAALNAIDSDVTEDPETALKSPDKTPMLVAIFETVSNVTAQTCAGTLLAPNWVLTAASCVNLLSNTTKNFINSTGESLYTIIINATDPLIDGTAHNVTQIFEPLPELTKPHDVTEVINVTENPERNTTENVSGSVTEDVNIIVSKKSSAILEFLKITKSHQTTMHPQTNDTDVPQTNVTQLINNVNETSQNIAKKIEQSNETDVVCNTNDDVSRNGIEITDSVEDDSADSYVDLHNTYTPSIALMRIEPPVPIENVDIVGKTDETNVILYGWVMRGEGSGHESIHKLALEAQTLSPGECADQYNITPRVREDELCLGSLDPYLALAGQMSWGGPIVDPSGGILAISRGDGSAPLSGTPLAQYSDWIHSVISSNSTGA